MQERYCRYYEEFKKLRGFGEDDVEDWKPGTRNEVVVYMKNGDILRYNGIDGYWGNITRYEEDEYGNPIMTDDEFRLEFSKKLQRHMRSEIMNQTMLAERSGISPVVLSRYMNGRNLPDARNLLRLATALNCSVSELLYFE